MTLDERRTRIAQDEAGVTPRAPCMAARPPAPHGQAARLRRSHQAVGA